MQKHQISRVILGLALALSLDALPATAQPAIPAPRTLVVSGQGEARTTPDTVAISAGVTTQGKTAADALAANTRAMNGVFAALKRLGVPDRAIQTSNFSVQPHYPQYTP